MNTATGVDDQPRVWLVLSDKGGDNRQVEIIAHGLGWPGERKYVHMRPGYVKGKPQIGASLHHIDLARSDPLEPPWPDLVITIGRRAAMAALWIREQAAGRTKIVLIGKPHGRLEPYDLIVVSRAENAVPPLPNVLPIALPLMRIEPDALAAAAEFWRPRLADLPRPLIGVLVGGPNIHFRHTGALVDRLLEAVGNIVARTGGTPYVITSRRTPVAVVEALQARLPPEARLFAWAGEAEANPYQALLALADGLIVTADSISMMVEVIRAGKPLAICPVPLVPFGRLDEWRRTLVRVIFAFGGNGPGARLRRAFARLLYRLRLIEQTRDFRAFQQLLFDEGFAVPLGSEFVPPPAALPDDVPEVQARIRALIGRDAPTEAAVAAKPSARAPQGGHRP